MRRSLWFVFFVVIFLFIVVVYKLFKIEKSAMVIKDKNVIVLKESGNEYGQLKFKREDNSFYLNNKKISPGTKFNLGIHSYVILTNPPVSKFETFLNKNFEDCRLKNAYYFLIGCWDYLKTGEKKKLLINISKNQMKVLGLDKSNGVLVKVYPFYGGKSRQNNLQFIPGKIKSFFLVQKNNNFKLIVKDKEGRERKKLKQKINGKKEKEGYKLESGDIVEFKNKNGKKGFALKFNIENVYKEISGENKYSIFTYLKVAIKKYVKKKIREAILKSDNGITYQIDLKKSNLLIGRGKLLYILKGDIVPPYVDDYKFQKMLKDFVDKGIVYIKNNKLEIDLLKFNKSFKFTSLEKKVILSMLNRLVGNINRQLSLLGFSLKLTVSADGCDNFIHIISDDSWVLYKSSEKNGKLECPTTPVKHLYNDIAFKKLAGCYFLTVPDFYTEKGDKYLVFEKIFSINSSKFIGAELNFFTLQKGFKIFINDKEIKGITSDGVIYKIADFVEKNPLNLKEGENVIRVILPNKEESLPLFNKPYIMLKTHNENVDLTKAEIKVPSYSYDKNGNLEEKLKKDYIHFFEKKKNLLKFWVDDQSLKGSKPVTRKFAIKFPPDDFKNGSFKITIESSGTIKFDGKNEYKKENTIEVKPRDELRFKVNYLSLTPLSFVKNNLLKMILAKENNKKYNFRVSKLYNPFLQVKSTFHGQFVDRDENSFPYFIITDSFDKKLIGKKIILYNKISFISPHKNSVKFEWKIGKTIIAGFKYENGKLNITEKNRGLLKIFRFEPDLKPYKWDNKEEELKFEDKLLYGNEFLIYQSPDSSNLFASCYLIPSLNNFFISKGRIDVENNSKNEFVEVYFDKDNKVKVKTNGKKILSLENMQTLKIGNISLLFVDHRKGVLADVNYNLGSINVKYPSGCVDFLTIVGWMKEKGSLFSIFKNYFKENKKVVLTIDGDIQELVLSECEKEIHFLKQRDLKRLRKFKNELLKKGITYSQQMEIKKKIEAILHKFYSGAFILMNEKNEILASVSIPYVNDLNKDYNISKVFQIGQLDYKESPLINRCTQISYPPGSSFKILTALTLMKIAEKNRKVKNYLSNCRVILNKEDLSGVKIYGKCEKIFPWQLMNFKREMCERCNIKNGFIHSYNTYFGYLGLYLSKSITSRSCIYKNPISYVSIGFCDENETKEDYALLKSAMEMGINNSFDLLPLSFKGNIIRTVGDRLSVLPSQFEINAYKPYEIARASIGQNIVSLTPLQNALIASVVLNEGKLYTPSLIKLEENCGFYKEIFKSKTTKKIGNYMNLVAKKGTAYGTFIDFPYIDNIYCKTGTAESKKSWDTHSWLVGYFISPENKKYVFAACFPNSGEGSRVAGQCVKRVLEKLVVIEKKLYNKRR